MPKEPAQSEAEGSKEEAQWTPLGAPGPQLDTDMQPIKRDEFEDIVREAIEGLPEEFLTRLENVDIVVEEAPTRAQLARNGLGPHETLYGLYEGVPLTDRHDYSMVVPDKITIFQRPLEAACEARAHLIEEVQATVVHEVAHFFGIDDEALDEMGLG